MKGFGGLSMILLYSIGCGGSHFFSVGVMLIDAILPHFGGPEFRDQLCADQLKTGPTGREL